MLQFSGQESTKIHLQMKREAPVCWEVPAYIMIDSKIYVTRYNQDSCQYKRAGIYLPGFDTWNSLCDLQLVCCQDPSKTWFYVFADW